MFMSAGEADQPEAHNSRQAGQSQRPLSPVSCLRQQLVLQGLVGERHDRKTMPLLNEFPSKP